MEAEHSARTEALLEKVDTMDVGGEADAYRSFDEDSSEECVEIGFKLAMKMVNMGAMAKYSGKNLQVFYAEDDQCRFYFIGADEDEVVKRVEALL